MIVLFNSRETDEDISIPYNDRALQFGDGLFETMRWADGKIQLLKYHLQRLHNGAEALGLFIPDGLSPEALTQSAQRLIQLNGLPSTANLKLMVWRSPEHQLAYDSNEHAVNTLLIARAVKTRQKPGKIAAFSQRVTLHYWSLSRFKTLSALPYVIATRERSTRKLDDLIILNTSGHVTECVASNIFWTINGNWFTPALSTGCIAGVMRGFIIDHFTSNKIPINEVEATPEVLLEAEAIFITNSQGIDFIQRLGVTAFDTKLAMKLKNNILPSLP